MLNPGRLSLLAVLGSFSGNACDDTRTPVLAKWASSPGPLAGNSQNCFCRLWLRDLAVAEASSGLLCLLLTPGADMLS